MDRRTLETAAAKYSYLRGLLFLPGGLLLILAALGNAAVGPFRHDWVFVLAVALLGGVALLINRFYNENYGRLTLSSHQQAHATIVVVLAIAFMVGGSMLVHALDVPENPIAVPFAIVMLISYGVGVGLTAHHVVIWGALLVAGALPVWTGEDPSNTGLWLSGVAVIVCGIFDHRLFVRTFGPPELPAHARV
jgi:hypothetical protein